MGEETVTSGSPSRGYAAGHRLRRRTVTRREPPKRREASRSAGRFIGVLVLLAGFALVVRTAATLPQARAVERSDPAVPAHREFAAGAGGSVHYRTFGEGAPVVVLVHPDTVAGGAVLVSLARQLGDDHLVLVPDLFGFGFSSRRVTPGRLQSTTGQAETLAAFIDEQGVSGVHLVVFGWGGEFATEM